MLNVAIVEDASDDLAVMRAHVEKYAEEHGIADLHVFAFTGAEEFLGNYRPTYDVVFMDIELPGANGMTASRALRVVDPHVAIVFTTNLASYAVEGYEVDALSYLLKPVTYPAFALTMSKVMARVAKRQEKVYLIQTADRTVGVPISSILYVEVVRHALFFHTTQGTYRRRGSMQEVEAELAPLGFCRCHSGYLVNVERVTSFSATEVVVSEETLPVSRQRKQAFMDALADKLGA